jgi:threonine dehydratase
METTFPDIVRARETLAGHAHVTPLFSSRGLSNVIGSRSVVLKGENLQRTGSYKFRGAFVRLSSLSREQPGQGVVAFSSGNHGQAVALAARDLGLRAVICLPTDASPTKVAAVRAYGAEIIPYDRLRDDREELAERLSRERELTLIPPYDDYMIIAGQGTVAAEFLDQTHGALDIIVAPVGGGGLMSGTLIASKAMNPEVQVIGVEPEQANDTYLSLRAKQRVAIAPPDTIADGVRTLTPGVLTFPILSRLMDDLCLVSEEEIANAVLFALLRLKLVLEPTAALPIAALLAGHIEVRDRRVGVIVSGGNLDAEVLRGMLAQTVAHGEARGFPA